MRARLLCSLRSECGSQSLNFGFAAVSAGRAGVIDHEEFATYMAQRSAGIAKQKELMAEAKGGAANGSYASSSTATLCCARGSHSIPPLHQAPCQLSSSLRSCKGKRRFPGDSPMMWAQPKQQQQVGTLQRPPLVGCLLWSLRDSPMMWPRLQAKLLSLVSASAPSRRQPRPSLTGCWRVWTTSQRKCDEVLLKESSSSPSVDC